MTKPPKKVNKDLLHSAAKNFIGLFPGGGALAELFQFCIQPSIEKRRDVWFEEIDERLVVLEQTNKIDIQELYQNEEFIDAFYATTRSAISTHIAEKRKRLLNALINVAFLNNIDSQLKSIFLYLIDKLTEAHIVTLGILLKSDNDPDRNTFEPYNVKDSPRQLIKQGLRNSQFEDDDLIAMLISDLNANHLTKVSEKILDSVPAMLRNSYVTDIGKQFIEFMEDRT